MNSDLWKNYAKLKKASIFQKTIKGQVSKNYLRKQNKIILKMIIKYKNSWVLWNREKSDKETIGYPKGPSSRD